MKTTCLHWPLEELTLVALGAFLSESLIGLLNLDIVASCQDD